MTVLCTYFDNYHIKEVFISTTIWYYSYVLSRLVNYGLLDFSFYAIINKS